ncbi:MAG: hypothetical protein K2L38_02650 [Dysosmobacter sp.]|nr:hypothetical protein [Dysosmobacter sp.]
MRERIDHAEAGTVFIPSDFADITEAAKVNMCLKRLKESGDLTSLKRGVYMKPRYSALLNQPVPARSDDVAKAMARNFGWTIVPCGDTALNLLGLSTQIPAVWSYVSDGPYRSYTVDGIKLQFNHTDRKSEIIGLSEKAALVIQALRAVGKENITQKDIKKLSGKLDEAEKSRLLLEGQRAAAWIYEAIKRICKGENQ